jgi:hypothetical protein
MSEPIVPPSAPVAAVTICITHLPSVASCCDVSLGDVMTLVKLELLPCPPEPPPLLPAPVAAVTICITHLSSVASCCDVSLGDVMTLVKLELLPCPPEPPPLLPAPVAAVTIACLFCSRISFLRCRKTNSVEGEVGSVVRCNLLCDGCLSVIHSGSSLLQDTYITASILQSV